MASSPLPPPPAQPSSPAYPVRLSGWLDEPLSRWLWLVKWLLALPHYLILFALWAAFFVLTVVAFFAVLFTGRYPHAIFEFNVGVLRWSWRVGFYAYSALGTDRYPPFTLADVPDYPARLHVAYPERLSRGLVLVKWWLLAIPHYLVVGVLLGGGYAVTWDSDNGVAGSWGLIGLLVLFAAVALLFRGFYPRPIMDLVVGLNRWVYRVAGYAALMTDEYPPFRLDQGGPDPDGIPDAPDPHTQERPPAVWSGGRITAVALGSVALLLGGALLMGGGGLLVAERAARDDDGFLMGPEQSRSTATSAIVSEAIDLRTGPADLAPERFLGDGRIEAESDGPVFVGVAPADELRDYLAGLDHEVIDFAADADTGRVVVATAPAPGPPDAEDIWVASSSGTGRQTVTVPLESGRWSVVVMRPDAAAGVDATARVGATVPALDDALVGAAVIGLVMIGVGVVAVVLAVPRGPGARDRAPRAP